MLITHEGTRGGGIGQVKMCRRILMVPCGAMHLHRTGIFRHCVSQPHIDIYRVGWTPLNSVIDARGRTIGNIEWEDKY